jgi:hypothetical protein
MHYEYVIRLLSLERDLMTPESSSSMKTWCLCLDTRTARVIMA